MKSLSEEMMLDCTYDTDGDDGCNGGWPADCWAWIRTAGSVIASNADYPYEGVGRFPVLKHRN